jgi:pyrroloquinoline quinone biosynthesis protein D
LSAALQSVPALRRGVRRHFDSTRNTPVLMAPERVVVLDDIADAILAECDGKRSITEIAAILAARFAAPEAEITTDVLAFFTELSDASLVTL